MNQIPSPFERYRHIVVEGPIGVGKTSLARKLSERFGTQLVLEEAGGNPFLERFYRDGRRYALPTQLFFLFQRVNQLEPLAQLDMFGRVTVSDFLIDKDHALRRASPCRATNSRSIGRMHRRHCKPANAPQSGPGDLPPGAAPTR
jgi:deoxyguanosine kinase